VGRLDRVTPGAFAAAAVVALPFTVALAGLHVAAAPSPAELAASDPLVRSLEAMVELGTIDRPARDR
jgi:hypothetical protein